MTRSRLHTFVAAAFLASALPAAAHAEDTPVVPRVGDHLRISLLAGPPPVTGRLLAHDPASLRILLDAAAVADTTTATLSRASIQALEVGTIQRHTKRGAIVGLVAGVVAGVIMVASVDETDPEPTVFAVALPPLLGAGIGALVGNAVQTERWQPARQP